MDVGAHITVRGVVQNVGFRYFVFTCATRVGVHGTVRNKFDGSVEIDVEGDRSLIEELINQIKIGPRASRVVDIAIDWKQPDYKFKNFEIW